MMQCRRYFVSGLVQGVFFRTSARKQAAALELTGWARNLSDGRVEVLACGEEAQLDLLYDWLKIGPPHAQVQDVETLPAPMQTLSDFKII